MAWLLPYPLTSAGLLALWLVLSQSIAPGQWLLGGGLALLGGRALALLGPERVRIRRPGKLLELMAVVSVDIAHSNLAVTRAILDFRRQRRTPGFVRIPLEEGHLPVTLAALACIITATPGTAWVQYLPAERLLIMHILELTEEAAWVDIIKNRYERRLLEIFA